MKRSKFDAKLFFGLFFLILILEFALVLSAQFAPERPSFLWRCASFLRVLSCMPLNLLDRSYPYYAMGPAWFGISLTVVNTGLQTVLVYFPITSYRKSRRK